ncbi:PHP domain-containing protein [Syntrophomonas curvata]
MIDGYDLHVHTTASDGALTPYEVIDAASSIGLKGIALTDHDTAAGLEPARRYLERNPGLRLELIPGIELNTEAGDEEVHILGYFIDPENAALNQHLRDIRTSRHDRALKIVDRLQQAGLAISFDQVQKLTRGESMGRPHIARALIENGYVNSIEEAFDKYIGRGRPGFVPRYKFLPAEAVELIKGAGGIAVLAHPGLLKVPEKIIEIIKLGIEGLEVYYPEHSGEQQQELAILAGQYKLLITGGSDFHGPASQESRAGLGSSIISSELLACMRLHLSSRPKFNRAVPGT